jgi:mRNA-degrading endonuclease HigB of HigAB toxin-antitoxin module
MSLFNSNDQSYSAIHQNSPSRGPPAPSGNSSGFAFGAPQQTPEPRLTGSRGPPAPSGCSSVFDFGAPPQTSEPIRFGLDVPTLPSRVAGLDGQTSEPRLTGIAFAERELRKDWEKGVKEMKKLEEFKKEQKENDEILKKRTLECLKKSDERIQRQNISTKFFDEDEIDNKKFDPLKAKQHLDNLEVISTDVNHVLSTENFQNSWSFWFGENNDLVKLSDSNWKYLINKKNSLIEEFNSGINQNLTYCKLIHNVLFDIRTRFNPKNAKVTILNNFKTINSRYIIMNLNNKLIICQIKLGKFYEEENYIEFVMTKNEFECINAGCFDNMIFAFTVITDFSNDINRIVYRTGAEIRLSGEKISGKNNKVKLSLSEPMF